ncbi:unnamed protein product [Musa acuminata subsp. burmannicoides]
MAAPLRRQGTSLARLAHARFVSLSQTRSLASDSLVELRPGEIGTVSGVPQEHLRRRVIIYSPARTATQQGSGKVGKWKINFVSTQKWENPLMGWTSTGDPYANVGDAGLTFDSEEAAKAFAEKYGWDFVVKKRHTPLLQGSQCRTVNVVKLLISSGKIYSYVLLALSNPIQTISSGRVRLKPRKVADHLIDVRRKKKSTSHLFYRTPPVCNFSYMFKTKAC